MAALCWSSCEEIPCIRRQGGSQEELLHVQGQWRPGGNTLPLRSGAARRSHLVPEARGGGQEDQPHVQGAMAVWAPEGLEELSHVEGQEGQR